ncbi:MAG: AzlD domain-containing protein, partial [Clostridia bacterium]|nr:AzlD domain-containing protein [Clostridia bacterium]
MSKANIFLLILGMTAVTYIPRAIPAVLVGRMKFG